MLDIVDPRGVRALRNEYDDAGRLISSTDAAGKPITYTHNLAARTETVTNRLGQVTTYAYDDKGNVLMQTDAAGGVTSFTYDAFGNEETRTDPLNRTTTRTYDLRRNVLQEADPLGHTTHYTYSALNAVKTITDPLGRVTTNNYDTKGNLTSTTDPLGKSTTYTYDTGGVIIQGAGNLLSTTDALNHTTNYAYDSFGNVTKETDPTGHVTTYTYDANGNRLSQTTTKSGQILVTTFTYDNAGNQTAVKDANNHTTSYGYDNANRRISVQYPDGTTETTSYDALGRTTNKTDQAGKTTSFTYDELGRLITVTDALGQQTTYTYDELGNQLTQTDANNHTTSFAYDQLGSRIKRTLPLGQFETYVYNTVGNLTSKTDFNGKTTTYAYDSVNRLTSKTPDPSLSEPAVTFTYTATGQRASMTDASGTTSYTYDNRDRLLSKTTPQGALTYSYDEAGNLLSMDSSHANGVSVRYEYDQLNRITKVIDHRQSDAATTYAYDNVGNLDHYDYPNGVEHQYTYNSLNRLTNLTVSKVTTLASYAYDLGPAGNRTAVTELSGRKASYTYDGLYRLTQEKIENDPASVNGTIDYAYDPVGNRKTRASTVAGITNQTFTYDANDRLNTDTYDDNGNTTGSDGKSYDYENHLTNQNGNGVVIVYDGDGNRVSKTVGGVVTQYLVDDRNHTGYAQVVEEIVDGTVERIYTYGLDLISQKQAGGVSYYGYDGHGSVRLLTDATGVVTDTYDYDAFGNLIHSTGSTSNNYLYTGEQLDPNVGFYYLRARYLNARAGRFITLDSHPGQNNVPATLHRYIYARNNASNWSDPSGEFSLSELSISTAIQGILRVQEPVKYGLALKKAKDQIAFSLGVLETIYAILQPDRTDLGWEFNLKFRDPFDRRVKPTITIGCSVKANSPRLCDSLELTLKPRATLPGGLKIGWDFENQSFSHSLFSPGIKFPILETSVGDIELAITWNTQGTLNPSDWSLKLAFGFSGGGSIVRVNAEIAQIDVPEDIDKTLSLFGFPK